MTATFNELQSRAQKFGWVILTENPDGDDYAYGEDEDWGPDVPLFWLCDANGHLAGPGLPLDLIEVELDLLAEEASQPRTPEPYQPTTPTKIADRPRRKKAGRGKKKTPRFIELELAQLDLFRDG